MYSFWHFDDFSWGNTRLVLGDDGQKKVLPADEGKFDPKSVPLKKWSDHENEVWETGSSETKGTILTSSSTTHRSVGAMPLGFVPPSSAGYMTPIYAASMNQLPVFNDAASFTRYSSHQNNFGRASSFAPSLLNVPATVGVAAGPPSIYSDGSVNNGYPPMNMMAGAGDVYCPTDEEIKREVQRITASADLMTMTKKQVREQLSRHFGINMSYSKDFINYCIEEALKF
jgi:chitin synthase